MNRNIIRIFFGMVWIHTIVLFAEVPSSESPEAFDKYVREVTRKLVGGDWLFPDPFKIREDPRDWEETLADIIADSEMQKNGLSQTALLMTIDRKRGNDPRIVAATIPFFQWRLHQAIELLNDSGGDRKKITKAKGFAESFIAETLGTESPEILQEVLTFLNSPEAERMGNLHEFSPRYIPRDLQKYGDGRHVEESRKLVAKLREIGRDDIADDIDRSIERIERDQKRSESERVGEGSSPDSATSDGGKQEGEEGVFTFPWIVGGVVVVVFISAGVFFLKRKK